MTQSRCGRDRPVDDATVYRKANALAAHADVLSPPANSGADVPQRDPLADCRLGRPDGRWTAAERPTPFAHGGPAARRAGVWSGDGKDRPELVDAGRPTSIIDAGDVIVAGEGRPIV